MSLADTPRAAAESGDGVLLHHRWDRREGVALGPRVISGLGKGGIYIDMSTIDPELSRAVAAEFAKAGRSCSTARFPAAPSP